MVPEIEHSRGCATLHPWLPSVAPLGLGNTRAVMLELIDATKTYIQGRRVVNAVRGVTPRSHALRGDGSSDALRVLCVCPRLG